MQGCEWILIENLETNFNEHDEQAECTNMDRHKNTQTILD